MSDSLSGPVYIDSVTVAPTSHRITLTDSLFEIGIFDRDQEVCHWAYDEITGTAILSNEELEDDAYHTVDDNSINDYQSESGSYNYTLTVPIEFFPPEDDASLKEIAEKVDEHAYIDENERRHYVINADLDMHKGEVRSVYLFSDEEVEERFSQDYEPPESFASKPQFL